MKIKFPLSLKKEKRGVVLVELSDRLLKVVQAAGEGSERKLVYLDAAELDFTDEERVSKELASRLKRLPRPPAEVFASLPRSQITTRTFFLPSTQPAELAKMVEFQIEKEIPFPKEKIIFDYHIIETTPEGYSRILLVIAGEEVVRRYLSILKKAGLVPAALFFSSQGLVSWFQRTQGEKGKETFFVLIDVDLYLTHVEVVSHGELYLTRSFLVGSRQIEKDNSPSQETFSQELNRTLVAFKKEFPFAKIENCFLSGGAKSLPLVERLVAPQIKFPFQKIAFRTHCPVEEGLAKEDLSEEISFSSAAGFLLRDEKRINLIPPSEKRARSERLFRRAVVQFVFLLVGSLLLLGFIFGSTLHQRRATLRSLQKELHALEPSASQVESMESQLDLLKGRERESEGTLEILRELYRTVPPEASLTYLAIEPTRISLRGASRNLSTVFSFAKSMESSPLFKSVSVKNATRRTLSEGEVTIFQIDAGVKTEKK